MTGEVINFINNHAGEVIKSIHNTGLFASVKMAQMILESSGNDESGRFSIGRSAAVRFANNYFGIKADAKWTGPKMALSTPNDGQPVNYFRVYASALDSIRDHTVFLLQNERYHLHGVFNARTPQEQTLDLQNAGYAESANYSNTLIKLIADYNLESLDRQVEFNYTGLCIAAASALLVSGLLYYQQYSSALRSPQN